MRLTEDADELTADDDLTSFRRHLHFQELGVEFKITPTTAQTQ
jgi:hypothetical protein